MEEMDGGRSAVDLPGILPLFCLKRIWMENSTRRKACFAEVYRRLWACSAANSGSASGGAGGFACFATVSR